MASKKKGNRAWVWMAATKDSGSNYRFRTQRNKANIEGKLRLRKYAPDVRKYVDFVEEK